MNSIARLSALALTALTLSTTAHGQIYSPDEFAAMEWRAIGPHRGGRSRAICGVVGQPMTFYFGACNGGVWKTTDAGHTWNPVFDDQPTGSIGSIAVSVSDPDVVYVGSGEALHRPDLSVGDGVYKSTDAGRTWTHLGLRDGQQIPRIAIDPRDPDRVFVAVLGHPYGPNTEGGIYRSLDGGESFTRVLYVDENTGGNDVDIDPLNPDVVYATLWEAREGPWENAEWSGTNGGVFKSTDGGNTWRKLTNGLPAESDGGVVQVNMTIAPSDPSRLYALVASARVGIFRSDDAGESWTRITTDRRPAGRIGGGDLPMPVAHPLDADTVVITSTVAWKSSDGGRTWTALKGAPGGDDYQNGWINPTNPDIMAMAADQGAVVTVNGGASWSSWYNQPTAQLYHVAADNAFPYRVYSGQQESGSVGLATRGNDGQIAFREWHPVGVDEYGYVAPDPLDPDIVYGGRSVTRYDRRTGQASVVGPVAGRGGGFRRVRTQPVVFSTVDPHLLFYANNVLWKTYDGGMNWTQISGDLTRETWDVPASVGTYSGERSAQPSRRGVIYTVAPSYVDVERIWIGTDDGLIHTTSNGGKTWTNVTPPDLGPWMKVSIIDAGRFDAKTAYAAINTLRLDDMRPAIYRTHDAGATWTAITNGLPDDAPINAVREDPVRPGLLFAGSEREVHVSLDDGDHWESLRLNMAPSSVRDIIVKNDDLVAATHGRGFWILDDITPLRQITGAPVRTDAILFEPQVALRVRWNMNTDTPLPPEEPTAPNPPDGAVINYYLPADAGGPVTLEIFDAQGRQVRRYASDDPVVLPDPATASVPLYWYRPPRVPGTSSGMHRFLWDLHYQPLTDSGSTRLPIAAVPHDTAPSPTTPKVAPGAYTVTLTVNGTKYTQPLTVELDPRLDAAELEETFAMLDAMYFESAQAHEAIEAASGLHTQLLQRQQDATNQTLVSAIEAFDRKVMQVRGEPRGRGRTTSEDLTGALAGVSTAMRTLGRSDAVPTAVTQATVTDARRRIAHVLDAWTGLTTVGLDELNDELKAARLAPVRVK